MSAHKTAPDKASFAIKTYLHFFLFLHKNIMLWVHIRSALELEIMLWVLIRSALPRHF